MIYRTIREWERIGYGDDDKTIPVEHADRIAAVAQVSAFSGRGEEGVLEHGRKGIRARGVVGVISTSGCQLEILPKIENSGEKEVKPETLRARLIHMLSVVYDLKIDIGEMTQLGWQPNTILEFLIRLFCDRLTNAVRRGMPRQYITHADDIPTMRGRLDINRQFTALAVSPQKLACRFDEFSPDIDLNRVMKATVSKLSRLTAVPKNQHSLRQLGFAYADVSDVPAITAYRLCDGITLDRTNQRWNDLLSLARIFLSDRHQQTTTGKSEGYALLFDMNMLFERYVARILSRALTGTNLRVSTQGGRRYSLYDGEKGLFQTRPDLIIRRGDEIAMIIDTKWKRITPRISDPKQGLNQADVYQMMAYSQIYDCANVMLLYPHHADLPREPILQKHPIAKPQANQSLTVATLNLAGKQGEHSAALRGLIENRLSVATLLQSNP